MKKAFFILYLAPIVAAGQAQAAVQAWVQPYKGPGNGEAIATAIAADANGNVFVTGASMSTNGYLDYATIKYSNVGLPLWTNRYDGPANSDDRPAAVALDYAGNVFVTGFSYGSGSFSDYATVAYSSAGVPWWTNRYNGSGNNDDQATAIAVDQNGDVYVVGYSSTASPFAYVTIKYSSAGALLWTNLYTGPDTYPNAKSAIAIDTYGNAFITMASMGTNGYTDYATIKYSNAGVPIWTNRYDGPGQYADIPVGVALDKSNNVFVTGVSYGAGTGFDFATIGYSAAGEPLWTNRYDGLGNDWDYAKAIAVDDVGNVVVTGESPPRSGSGPQYATVAYSGSGIPIWTNFYTGVGNDDEPAAIGLDKNGNVIVTGYSIGIGTSADFATVKYSSLGVPLWTNRYDGSLNNPDYANAVAVDASGNVFVTGLSDGGYATIKYSNLQPIPLGIQKLNGQVVLTWPNTAFSLQSAPAITGMFTNVPGATSPYTNPMSGAQQFFRLSSN